MLGVVVPLVAAAVAMAQTRPLPQVQTPQGPQLQPGQFLPAVPPPPGSVPVTPGPAAPPAPSVAPSPAPVAPVQQDWVSQPIAELRGVDKVTARTTSLSVKVGETVQFGPLSVTVRGCVVRPPDRAPDAAAFLEISEAGKPPLFRGWMVVSQPQLAVVEHPTHDVRLMGCKA